MVACATEAIDNVEARALREEDFRNDKVDAGDIGSGHAVTAIYEITPSGPESSFLTSRVIQSLRINRPLPRWRKSWRF